MRFCKTFFVFLLLAATLCGEQVTISIRNNNVKARKTPNASAQVVATLSRDEVFLVRNDVPFWFQIRLRNRALAWVPKSQTTVVDPDEEIAPGETPNLNEIITLGPPVTLENCTPSKIQADFSICPPTGSGGRYAKAYVQKNRIEVPCTYRRITPEDILKLPLLNAAVRAQPEDDNELAFLKEAEAVAVRLDGFLAMTKNGGKEGVNCGSTSRIDLRMEIVPSDVPDPKTTRRQHVVTEGTPWFRTVFADWKPSALGKFSSYIEGFSGGFQRKPMPIRVYGFLFFDEAHLSDGSINSIRGTVWEVHPVTRIEVQVDGQWQRVQ